MGCGCKKDSKIIEESVEKKVNDYRYQDNKIFMYSVKSILFLVVIPMVILILPYVFYVLFKKIVLDKDFNLVSDITKVLKNKKGKNEDDIDDIEDDEEELDDEFGENYDDIVEDVVDVEMIETSKKN